MPQRDGAHPPSGASDGPSVTIFSIWELSYFSVAGRAFYGSQDFAQLLGLAPQDVWAVTSRCVSGSCLMDDLCTSLKGRLCGQALIKKLRDLIHHRALEMLA